MDALLPMKKNPVFSIYIFPDQLLAWPNPKIKEKQPFKPE
jgi:hypothetical protein